MEMIMTSRHHLRAVAALAAAGLALGGCAAMPDQTQTASTQGCKIVLIDNTAQELSAYNSDMHRDKSAYAQGQIQQNYADAKVGDAQNRDRRPVNDSLQFHGTPNAMTDARRGC
jgi:hypothetical protein